MRITPRQHQAILRAVREVFGDTATVRLFGSRAHDHLRGGDIDLYVCLPAAEPQARASRLVARICTLLGDELPIDVVVRDANTPTQAIHLEAEKGIHTQALQRALQHAVAIKQELDFSYGWLAQENINAEWVRGLDDITKERVSGFYSRFARFQDYLADKLLRRWLDAAGEPVSTAIENYAIAERAGVLAIPSEAMLELRSIRNKRSHEYQDDPTAFAQNLQTMLHATRGLAQTFENLREHSQKHLGWLAHVPQ